MTRDEARKTILANIDRAAGHAWMLGLSVDDKAMLAALRVIYATDDAAVDAVLVKMGK